MIDALVTGVRIELFDEDDTKKGEMEVNYVVTTDGENPVQIRNPAGGVGVFIPRKSWSTIQAAVDMLFMQEDDQ
ncbi:hypothetical protein [Marinobacter nauticus]|uniref:Uncharacterized protein n=1 Tax=Marinobacter nauticus TaxID=2743 RepID=A0A833NBM4_MARNT|nr:hypothetical protein [Marinobacter nauticus]KAE8546170.1 hypothetical protein F6453_1416 [Marinobacter nauticus]